MAEEKFSWKKLIGGFSILNPILWSKTLTDVFRVILVSGLVFGAVWGWGYLNGLKNRPINTDKDFSIAVTDKEGKTHAVEAKNGNLYFDGEIVKNKALVTNKPYGIKLQPGIGYIETRASFFLTIAYVRQFEVDLMGNQSEFGAGVSYKLNFEKPLMIKNTSIGAAYLYRINQEDKIIKAYVKISF